MRCALNNLMIYQKHSRAVLAAVSKGQRSRAKKSITTEKTRLRHQREPATVLVIDDDPSILTSLRRLLVALGFRVEVFDRPSALLAATIPRSNACMIVDVNLPEMSGIKMCEMLKGTKGSLPTIVITGRTDERVHSIAANSGSVAVLLKPFDQAPLLDAIGRALALST